MTIPDFTNGQSARDLRRRMAEDQAEIDAALDRRSALEEAAETERAFAIRHHGLTVDEYQDIVDHATRAAAAGHWQILAMRFPSRLCSDHGRAIIAGDADWPDTLPQKPRALYDHWRREERGLGYHLSAAILDYPDGLPGDVGLILDWRAESDR